ncbi:hypothetical protein IC620_08990 [Hazenella sp. IB182357]|uniref:Uncharacterized protein n=1 Tax=Polycladospora coralii TaxID=2771432 RepID=A0A926NAI4_9BACL|nr:hypothetical protein [Polycladospora coralii]MBD1372492.1 hypothetical protein [Polycladospora coralii]
MYQLVLYNELKEIIEVFKNLQDVTVKNGDVYWNGGELRGIGSPFIVINQDVELNRGDTIDDNHIQLDQKDSLKDKMTQLEEMNKQLQGAVNFLLGI